MLDLSINFSLLMQQVRLAQKKFSGTDSYFMEAEPWTLDTVTTAADGTLSMTGWILPPSGSHRPKFSINGTNVDQVQFPINRLGMQELFWQRENADNSGFIIKSKLTAEELFKEGYINIRVTYRGQPLRYRFQYDWYLPSPQQNLPLPDETRRFRVIGTHSEEPFLRGGFTDFMRMRQLLKRLVHKDYSDFRSILDWGCGCGRVARHFSEVKHAQFTGADIDGDNIEWCAENLKFGRFEKLSLFPPTVFSDREFDLIYGISVFTHLREEAQDAWLEELHRISKPGALIMVTCHGATTLNYARLNKEQLDFLFSTIEEQGFYITASNDQINEFIDDQDYYVNVNHSHKYIHEHWGKYFQILDIVPGFIYTHDMVVMRKRQ